MSLEEPANRRKVDEALQERFRTAMVLTKAYAEKHFCAECHDGDNSPDFKFETYWPKIVHKEKDEEKPREKPGS